MSDLESCNNKAKKMGHELRKSVYGVCDKLDSNQPAQLQRLARIVSVPLLFAFNSQVFSPGGPLIY